MSLLLAVLWCASATAKQLHGRVTDDQRQPLAQVIVRDVSNGNVAATDSAGYFSIEVVTGDKMMISHLAYQPYYFTVDATESPREIRLQSKDVQLGEVKIHSPMAKFKRDSELNHQVYRKELGYAKSKVKPNVSVGTAAVGVSFDGIFSELALRASGKKKRFKHFAATMQNDEEQRFIGLRYNSAIVAQVTGLNDSMSTNFVTMHPMRYDFARVASDLELKSWILNEYRVENPTGEIPNFKSQIPNPKSRITGH